MRFKTMFRKVATVIFIATFSGSLAAGADKAQPQANFIKPGARTTEEIVPPSDGLGNVLARFPVTLEGTQANEITLRVIDLLLNNKAQSNLFDAFTPGMEAATERRGPAILIEVNFKKITEQGKYFLQGNYSLTIEASKRQAKPVLIELQVVLSSAKARLPKSLVVERVLPFFSIDPDVKDSMKLEELSRRARLTDIVIDQFEKGADEDGLQVDGEIVFTNNGTVIKPGETESFEYNLKGDFPLGTTKGTIEVKAPQLAESLPINFEIKSRVHRWVIFLLILIGLVVGWFVRTGLQRRIELNGIRLQGIELQKRIAKELSVRSDEEFRAIMNKASAELEGALNGSDAASLKAAITKCDKELTDALTDLKARRETARVKLDGIKNLTRFSTAPEAIAAAVKAVSARIDEVEESLKKDNVKEADRQAEAIRADLGGSLAAPVREWPISLIDYLDKLSDGDVLLPSSVVLDLKAPIESVKSALDQVGNVDAQKTTEEITAVFESIRKARADLEDLLFSLKVKLDGVLNVTIDTLSKVPIPDGPAVKKLRESLAEFKTKLDVAPDNPQIASKELQDHLKSLHNAWSAALLNQVPANHADRPAVEKLIQDRDYISAARKVAEILEPDPADALAQAEAALAASTALRGDRAFSTRPARDASFDESAFITRIEVEEERRDPLVVQEARTRMQLFKDTLLRNLLVALLVTMVGYLMFSDKFVGTLDDVGKVFFWAFTIDLTVEALVLSTKALKSA